MPIKVRFLTWAGHRDNRDRIEPSFLLFLTGVDISDVAIDKAMARAREAGVADRREYRLSDILTYVPERQYNVILFGDSIYYMPFGRIASTLSRYGTHLSAESVFVVRLFDVSGKRRQIVDIIESHFFVVEKHENKHTHVCKIVFRPDAGAGSLTHPHD